jgi:hypothetical protein
MSDQPPSVHFGHRALQWIHQIFELDDAHTLAHDDGFSWWPGEVPVRFRWRAPVAGEGLPLWRLSAEIEAVRGVDPTSRIVVGYLMMTSTLWNQFSMVVEDGTLKLRALVYALPEGDTSVLGQLTYRAAFMARVAEQIMPNALTLLGGGKAIAVGGPELIRSAHPVAGRRCEPATQLEVLLEEALRLGGSPSPLDRRPDLGAAMVALRQAGCDKVAGPHEHKGLDDVRFFNVVVETKLATSLLELRLDEANPNVGRGLLAVLRVRFPKDHLHGDAHRLARELNDAEWRTTRPLHVQGTWSANATGADVAHSAFYPNLMHHPALGREVALDGLRRVRWVFDHFGYDEPFTREGPYTNLLSGRPEAAGMEA